MQELNKPKRGIFLELWLKMPPYINYLQYRFDLQLKVEQGNIYVGYYVTHCYAKGKSEKKQEKIEAFKQGIWTDRYTNRLDKMINTVNSNHLFKVLVDEMKDIELYWSMSALYDKLCSYSLINDYIVSFEDLFNTQFLE